MEMRASVRHCWVSLEQNNTKEIACQRFVFGIEAKQTPSRYLSLRSAGGKGLFPKHVMYIPGVVKKNGKYNASQLPRRRIFVRKCCSLKMYLEKTSVPLSFSTIPIYVCFTTIRPVTTLAANVSLHAVFSTLFSSFVLKNIHLPQNPSCFQVSAHNFQTKDSCFLFWTIMFEKGMELKHSSSSEKTSWIFLPCTRCQVQMPTCSFSHTNVQ